MNGQVPHRAGPLYVLPNHVSEWERQVVGELGILGYKVEPSARFGSAIVDAYLPDYHVALECDGPRHRKEVDRNKDRYLEQFGLKVFRIHWRDVPRGKLEKQGLPVKIVGQLRKFVERAQVDVDERRARAHTHPDMYREVQEWSEDAADVEPAGGSTQANGHSAGLHMEGGGADSGRRKA